MTWRLSHRTVSFATGSLHAYKKALEIYRAEHQGHHNGKQAQANGNHKSPVPLNPKLLNNAAVMHMRGGNYKVALELMEEAIQVSIAQSSRHSPDVLFDEAGHE